MLYRYIVENFKSFRDQAELAMIPSVGGCSHLIDGDTNIPVLKTAVIYGANASGKSNLVRSMAFARDLILNKEKVNGVSNPCYRLDQESMNRPTVFHFELKINEALYQYGFSILFSKSLVTEEWLYEMIEKKPLFSRAYNEAKFIYDYEFETDDLSEEERNRMSVYMDDLKNAKDRLVLTELAQKKLSDEVSLWNRINEVYTWFKKLTIIFPNTRFNLLTAVVADESKINNLYKDYFRLFNLAIDNIHLNQVPIAMLPLNQETLAEIKSDLLAKDTKGDARGMINLRGHEYLLELDELGDLTAKEVKFCHLKREDGGVADFSKWEESDGTQRLFDLIPALARLVKQEGAWVIDEIDRTLHSLVTRTIIAFFLKESQGIRSQLICTTHEQLLLDISLLRTDEIWLTQKNSPDEISELYPLAKYKVKFPENIEKNYLLGRYRGIPVLDD